MSAKTAVMIDAENISYRDLPDILEVLPSQDDVVLQAIYGDWDKPHLAHWHTLATENAFIIRHQTNYANTKNAADMRLIMDAMDVLHYKPFIDVFYLVTNDADYVPLCEKLREAGKRVIGIGHLQAADALIRACDQFVFIRHESAPVAMPVPAIPALPTSPSAPPLPPLPESPVISSINEMRMLLSGAFTQASPNKRIWLNLPTLGKAIRQVKPDFDVKRYGFATLSQMLTAIPSVVETKGNGSGKLARLKEESDIHALLQRALKQAKPEDKCWMPLATLGATLNQLNPDFRFENYGYSTFTQMLQSQSQYIELRYDGKRMYARLKTARPKLNDLQKLVYRAFTTADTTTAGWVDMGALGNVLRQCQPGFSAKSYGHSTLTKLLESMPEFVEIRTVGTTKSARWIG